MAAVLTGLGTYLPPTVVTNAHLAQELDTSDEWIRSRTGIGQRHIAEPGVSTSDLAVAAGERALKSAGDPDVDVVVLATTTPDHPCPATAPAVAARLGLTGRGAFDISAVCSGFIYGLATATGFIAAGTARTVLVIGAETYSSILDPADRSTRAIFGDGAGAAVLRAGDPGEPGAVGRFDLGSDGELAGLISRHEGGYFQMQGKAVFRHAVLRMAESIRRVAEPSEVDRLVVHQANARILSALTEELGLPGDRVVGNIATVGNTAAASIPLALADAVRAGELAPGHRVALSAFGGGLTWGSTTLTWPDINVI